MPPTRAAATNTACGRLAVIQASTAGAWRRSQSTCATATTSQRSIASRRTSASPTRPRWPATQTRLFCSAYGEFVGIVGISAFEGLPVGFDHLGNQLLEGGLVTPAEPLPGLLRISEQQIDLGRTVIMRVDRDQAFAAAIAQAALVGTRSRPDDRPADAAERPLDELAHRMRLAGGKHIVVGLLLLEDEPHAFDIVTRMAPIALRVDVAEIEPLLHAALNGGAGAADLAGDEGFAADRRFVIEQDAVRRVQAIGLAVIDRDPIGVKLGDRIRAARIEGRQLVLRRLHHLAEQLGRRCLIEPHAVRHLED